VAGIESGTPGLWGVRGTSWTQNLVRVDGADVTDPSGGRALLYLDLDDFEQLALSDTARPPRAGGAGRGVELVSRQPPGAFGGSALFRYTGSALQSDNRARTCSPKASSPAPSRASVGQDRCRRPRPLRRAVRVPSHHLDPRFPGEAESRLLSALGKLERGRFALLGIAQGLDQPTYGARPGASRDATIPASESFLLGQARFADQGWAASVSFARGVLDALSSAETPALFDLATGEVGGAPLASLRRDGTRLDWPRRAS
jgi:hypothetical protein